MSWQCGKLLPTIGLDQLVSLGHPSKFQQVSRLRFVTGSVTARHSNRRRQLNFAAWYKEWNYGTSTDGATYMARRPSRWASAHISSIIYIPNLSLVSLLDNMSVILTTHIHLLILISARRSDNSFSFFTGYISLPCNMQLCSQLLYNFSLIRNETSWLVSRDTSCLNWFIPYVLYTVCQKNVPPSTCHNLDIHDLITRIFGGSVTEKVKNHMTLCFPTSPV